MSKEQAELVFDVLTRICGAAESARGAFVQQQSSGYIREWRFGGNLGFGGKLIWDGDYPLVSCYPEDRDTNRVEIITDANRALVLLGH